MSEIITPRLKGMNGCIIIILISNMSCLQLNCAGQFICQHSFKFYFYLSYVITRSLLSTWTASRTLAKAPSPIVLPIM